MEPTYRMEVSIGTPVHKPTIVHRGGPTVMFQLHDFEQVLLTAQAVDKEGNPSGDPVAWSSSDETVVGLQDNGDGTCLAIASPGEGGLGTATVKATVLDDVGNEFTGTFEIEVIPGDSVAVNVTPGTPEPKA